MISMLPEKLDCLPILPSSSQERVSEMLSSNSIWQLRRLNCLSEAPEEPAAAEEASSCQLALASRISPGFSRRHAADDEDEDVEEEGVADEVEEDRSLPFGRLLQPSAVYAEPLPKSPLLVLPLPLLPFNASETP